LPSGVQGYELLLPESLPYTQAILATGRFLGLPTTFVTNGVKLGDAVDLLKTLSPSKIAISLDAASAEIHDRIRGVAGSWAVAGIKRAIEALATTDRAGGDVGSAAFQAALSGRDARSPSRDWDRPVGSQFPA
jgi:hypothetical protein